MTIEATKTETEKPRFFYANGLMECPHFYAQHIMVSKSDRDGCITFGQHDPDDTTRVYRVACMHLNNTTLEELKQVLEGVLGGQK